MKIAHTYEIAPGDIIDGDYLEEIATLIAQMIYQSTIRKDGNEETLPSSL